MEWNYSSFKMKKQLKGKRRTKKKALTWLADGSGWGEWKFYPVRPVRPVRSCTSMWRPKYLTETLSDFDGGTLARRHGEWVAVLSPSAPSATQIRGR